MIIYKKIIDLDIPVTLGILWFKKYAESLKTSRLYKGVFNPDIKKSDKFL